MKYTKTKIDFIGRSSNYNLEYVTYDFGEEFYSLPSLEERIDESIEDGTIDDYIINQGKIKEIETDSFPSDEDRYEELELEADLLGLEIAEKENTFFK